MLKASAEMDWPLVNLTLEATNWVYGGARRRGNADGQDLASLPYSSRHFVTFRLTNHLLMHCLMRINHDLSTTRLFSFSGRFSGM
jgi:hypothetical protein